MFNIGPQELLVILLVALVIVGPRRLPELARTIGRGLRELRKAQDEVTRTIRLGLDDAEPTRPRAPARPAPASAEGASEAAPEGMEPTVEESASDLARSLGRGLAEIRRARRELQRTFRVDLGEEAAPRRPSTGGVAPSPREARAPAEPTSPPPAEPTSPPPAEPHTSDAAERSG